jgi:hypothetical protein
MSDVTKPCPTCGIIESIVLDKIISLESANAAYAAVLN